MFISSLIELCINQNFIWLWLNINNKLLSVHNFIVTAFEIQDDHGMPVNDVSIQILEDSIRKDIVSDQNSLHRAITPVLTLAHFFALLPVQGIKGQNTSYLVWVIKLCNYLVRLHCYNWIYYLQNNTNIFNSKLINHFNYWTLYHWFYIPRVGSSK